MPRDDPPTPHEWLVVLVSGDDDDVRPGGTPTHEERVPESLGGVDVGMMSASEHGPHFVVISDAENHAVWMRDASTVRGVKRCASS